VADRTSQASPLRPDVAAPLLITELLYQTPPEFDPDEFRQRMALSLPHADIVTGGDKQPVTLVGHQNHRTQFEGGKSIPAQTAVMLGSPFIAERFESAIGQSWGWPEARDAVTRCRHQIIVTELMTHTLDRKIRLELYEATLCEVMAVAPPAAVFCSSAERIIEPEAIIRAALSKDPAEQFAPFLNVRLIRVGEQESDELLMDTRGLAAMGLPDLQVHFRDLDPTSVASLLYNCGFYVFEHGDCIENGHTIQGLTPDQKWTCQHQPSLLPPARTVVDFNPGGPFAAGDRGEA